MEWVNGDPFLIDEITPQAIQHPSMPIVEEVLKRDDLVALLPDYTRVLVDADRSLAVLAAFPVAAGVYETWALFSDEALRHPRELLFGAQTFEGVLVEREPVVRLQTEVDEGHVAARCWLKHLHYTHEGTHPRKGPGGVTLLSYGKVL